MLGKDMSKPRFYFLISSSPVEFLIFRHQSSYELAYIFAQLGGSLWGASYHNSTSIQYNKITHTNENAFTLSMIWL